MRRYLGWLTAIAVLGGALLREHLPDWASEPRYWWRTPDQVGHARYEQGDVTGALGHFRLAAWRGAACYRSGDLACAEAAFAQAALLPAHAPVALADGAALAFNRGNVAARAGRLADAVAHYDTALRLRPAWAAARDNRALVLTAIRDARRTMPPEPVGEPMLPPDGAAIDERGTRGTPGRIEVEKIDSDALAALWLRNVRSDPGAFLRLRFAEEQRRAEAEK